MLMYLNMVYITYSNGLKINFNNEIFIFCPHTARYNILGIYSIHPISFTLVPIFDDCGTYVVKNKYLHKIYYFSEFEITMEHKKLSICNVPRSILIISECIVC